MPTPDAGPTLTNVTYMGRQALKFGLILIIVLMVGRTFLNAFTAYWKATHPPKAAPPTIGFGILPNLEFPETNSSERPSEYTLETKTGTFPKMPTQAGVYFMPDFSSTLFDDESTREIAAAYGFVLEPEIIDKRTYRFSKSSPLQSTLDIDIRAKTFELQTNYLSRQELLINKNLPDTQTAISQVKSYLSTAGLLDPDLEAASSSAAAKYLKTSGKLLEEAFSVREAEFIQVDLGREPIAGQYELFTPKGHEGTVNAIITGAFGSLDNIVYLRNKHYPVDYESEETYPLRNISDAWHLLQSGEGYVYNPQAVKTAVVRYIYLGYFDNFEHQEYLQPIYVFEGDEGFLGYVSAIESKYLQQ